MLRFLLVIVQDNLGGVLNRSINGTLHRMREYFSVFNSHKSLGRETNKPARDIKPIGCFAAQEYFLQGQVGFNRCFDRQVGKKGISVAQTVHYVQKPFGIPAVIFGEGSKMEMTFFRFFHTVSYSVYIEKYLVLLQRIFDKKAFSQLEIQTKQKGCFCSSGFVHSSFYIVARGKHPAKLTEIDVFLLFLCKKEASLRPSPQERGVFGY